ncbi:MAG: hypothetical protein K2X27_07760 [Candidatus Obscuribacterales bacterium]|nr:hypothetical protein [Candidatus Obscuribacterales bacterium]
MPAAQSVIDTDSWGSSAMSVALPPMVSHQERIETASFKELPDWTPRTHSRHVPFLVKMNRVLRAILIACCGFALLGYGLDVAASAEVSKLQEQARRLSEQNTELSAQLLRAISFQGIQASVVGRAGLRVPERVIIAKEVKPQAVQEYKPRRHFLPLMSGY